VFAVTKASQVNENSNNEKMANHCVLLIANHRNSDSLRGWLNTGILHPSDMEPAAALEYLVPGNHDAEDEFVVSCYTAALNDTPSQKPELDRALRAIAKHRNSSLLLSMSGGPATDRPVVTHNLSEWPIGLENIGNTCYLNSLLQFFFTIKPLRSLVLDNEGYLMEINDSTVKKKKVGSRQVTRKEIERAQQCKF
jgi:ubiquitin carboxyl-terminal hydrolase 25